MVRVTPVGVGLAAMLGSEGTGRAGHAGGLGGTLTQAIVEEISSGSRVFDGGGFSMVLGTLFN